jgi:uncharacterized membrane protein
MQIAMSVLVLLRVWILYGRTRKITVALVVAFILYLCTSIALLAYILGAISCKSTRAARIARQTETVVCSHSKFRNRGVWGRRASYVLPETSELVALTT